MTTRTIRLREEFVEWRAVESIGSIEQLAKENEGSATDGVGDSNPV